MSAGPDSNPEHDEALIQGLLDSDRVVLFMKGSREQPQCEPSAATLALLDQVLDDYATVDVLRSSAIREGVKRRSDWPTIPQLFVDGEFIGGADIVRQLYNTGELHELFDQAPPERTVPRITLSDEAARIIREALDNAPDHEVHLAIDPRFEHRFSLAPAEGHEIVSHAGDLAVHLDADSAARADGVVIDVQETYRGHVLEITNPNAPPPVRSLTVHELAAWLRRDAGPTLVDVRTPAERERACIDPSTLLDEAAFEGLRALPADTALVFFCHHGQRSMVAAEHFRNLGFREVHNLEGGIEAWSREIDPSVPRY